MIGYSQAFDGLYGPKPFEGKNTMNERIRELAKHAEKLANEETKAFTDNTGQWRVIWNEVYDKKFAELIVRECADVACKHMELNEGTDYNVGDKIKQHFGVEE